MRHVCIVSVFDQILEMFHVKWRFIQNCVTYVTNLNFVTCVTFSV